MKTISSKSIAIGCLTLILLVAGARTSTMGQEIEQTEESQKAADSGQNSLIGVWETTVTPRNCLTGEAAGPAFIGLITFHKGGTLSEFGANPATPFRTPGHGTWQSAPWLGEDRYLLNFTFIPLTPAGVPVGRLKVSQTLNQNRYLDQGSTSGGFQLFNLGGVVIGSGCSTSTATRFR